MYFVYVLKSLKDNKFYIGSTQNIEDRLKRHNSGRVTATRYRVPFSLIYQENFETRKEALAKERELKKHKSHKIIEVLAQKYYKG